MEKEKSILNNILVFMDRATIKGRNENTSYLICCGYIESKIKELDAPVEVDKGTK